MEGRERDHYLVFVVWWVLFELNSFNCFPNSFIPLFPPSLIILSNCVVICIYRDRKPSSDMLYLGLDSSKASISAEVSEVVSFGE